MAMYVAAIFAMIPSIRFLWLTRHPFPPQAFTATTLPFLFICFWKWSWDGTRHAMGITTRTSTVVAILGCRLEPMGRVRQAFSPGPRYKPMWLAPRPNIV
jgi:hypothetical protein